MRQVIRLTLFCAVFTSLLFAGDYRFAKFDFPDAASTEARGINARGDIVGSYTDVNDVTHGFLLRDGAFSGIDVPGGAVTIGARGINARGDIVGQFLDANSAGHGYLLQGKSGMYPILGPDMRSPQRVASNQARLRLCPRVSEYWGTSRLSPDFPSVPGFPRISSSSSPDHAGITFSGLCQVSQERVFRADLGVQGHRRGNLSVASRTGQLLLEILELRCFEPRSTVIEFDLHILPHF